MLFVQRGMPGDTVRARVTRVKRSFAEAVAEQVLATGPDTIEAPCPYFGTCGGCAWQSLDYTAQLAAKQSQVLESIQRIGGIADPPLEPIIPAIDQFGYRNKMEYTFTAIFADDDELEIGESTVGLGFHRAGRWDQIVGVDPCLIADPRGVVAHKTTLDWANEHNLKVYDRDTGKGMLRNLVVRVGRNTGEVVAHLVTGPTPKKLAELVDDLTVNVPGLVGVLHSTNSGSAEVASGDDGAAPTVLWGREYFEETLGGERLRVRPGSFLQTNTQMADRLYELVREVAVLRPNDVAFDLYCGIGSITLMLARHVERVVGVEVVQEAIDCAIENAELNGVENIEFQVGNVRPILKFAKGVWPEPSIVVVDPPRSGLVEKVVRRICEFRPERVIYVSCNPATFAGNLPWFRENGYELVFVQAVDQFPHTHHVELVARLEPIPGWVPPPSQKATAERLAPDERPAPVVGPPGDTRSGDPSEVVGEGEIES